MKVLEKQDAEKFKPFKKHTISPCPATYCTNIVCYLKEENIQIQVTDVNGKILKTINVVTQQYNVTINFDLLDGVYFVNIINESGEKTVKKLVVAN
ncbi:MAG: T9SS type A sorting domain-containing protein [Bacteroidetes bacterium]|nr:T9SS type A sorting domain-containing protein [Bacteroidota bacterium]MCA6443851.1 T9SS type A sorting domain-containing protein [Bacteroidota bacterium]